MVKYQYGLRLSKSKTSNRCHGLSLPAGWVYNKVLKKLKHLVFTLFDSLKDCAAAYLDMKINKVCTK